VIEYLRKTAVDWLNRITIISGSSDPAHSKCQLRYRFYARMVKRWLKIVLNAGKSHTFLLR